MENHRNFSRVLFAGNAHLAVEGQRRVCHVIDISLKGSLISTPDRWAAQIGEETILEVRLDDKTVIRMNMRVAHIENEHIGLACTHIDLESITHLRRLMELNIGDEAQLNRELTAMLSQSGNSLH